jgi:apolipoprotein N-acyltransferase
MKKSEINLLILPLLSALILALARLPIYLGFICYCGFIPLFFFFDKKPSLGIMVKGAGVFSLVYTVVALHWITLVTLPGFIGMIFLFFLYFLIVFYLNRMVWQKNYPLRYLGFILIWVCYEHLQGFGQFSFPWFYTGYSLGDYTTLLQPLELGGITLITLFIMVTNLLIYQLLLKKNLRFLLAVILLHLTWSGISVWRYHTIPLENTHEEIAIVQVSIPQHLKWKKAYKDTTLELYREYTGKVSPDAGLVIFPESAIPGYVLTSYKYGSYMRTLIHDSGKSIFTGFPDYVYDKDRDEYLYYNTCTMFDSLGSYEEPYYKNILVPFGERMPLMSLFPVLNRVDLGQANWEFGKGFRSYNYRGLKISPQICFEVAFPSYNAKMAKENPDVIFNLTNDAWFYHSAGTYQHSLMTCFRAIETRTQYYRAANTGYSMIVNPRGDVLQKSKLFTREVIEDEVYTYHGQSLYVRYFHYLPDILAALTALLLIWSIIKKS